MKKGGRNERDGDECCTCAAGLHPTDVHRKLSGERARRKLRKREALDVVLPQDPATFFAQVLVHSAG
jgi:hypothetical protein